MTPDDPASDPAMTPEAPGQHYDTRNPWKDRGGKTAPEKDEPVEIEIPQDLERLMIAAEQIIHIDGRTDPAFRRLMPELKAFLVQVSSQMNESGEATLKLLPIWNRLNGILGHHGQMSSIAPRTICPTCGRPWEK